MANNYFPAGEERLAASYISCGIFVLVIGASLLLGSHEDWVILNRHVRGLYVWELLSVFTTLFLTIIYFADMVNLASDTRQRSEQLWIGYLNASGLFLIIGAAACLFAFAFFGLGIRFYWFYFILSAIGFVIFAALDYLAARILISYRKTREYWALCCFNDGPTAVAFVLLLIYSTLYYIFNSAEPNFDVIGGAVAMQMLINSAIYLGVISNFVFRMFTHYCGANIGKID